MVQDWGNYWKKRRREEAEKLAPEVSQPTATSNTTISHAQAAEIRAHVRQAINEGFAKARSKMAEVPKTGIANPSPSVIDLVTWSIFPCSIGCRMWRSPCIPDLSG